MANDVYGAGGYDPTEPHNNLIERWDDDSKTYTDFRTDPPTSRAYSTVEVDAANRRTASFQSMNTRATQRAAVKAVINELQAEKARCDAVIAKTNAQITGGDTKDIARAAKRIADAAIDLARFVQDH